MDFQVGLNNNGTNPAQHVIIDNTPLPTSEVSENLLFTGKTTVTTSGTRVQLTSTTVCKSVTVKALSTNTGIIYVGNSGVTSTNGFQLGSSESISMDLSDPSAIWVDASTNSQGVSWIYISL